MLDRDAAGPTGEEGKRVASVQTGRLLDRPFNASVLDNLGILNPPVTLRHPRTLTSLQLYEVTIEWDPPARTNGGIEGYLVYHDIEGEEAYVIQLSTGACTHTCWHTRTHAHVHLCTCAHMLLRLFHSAVILIGLTLHDPGTAGLALPIAFRLNIRACHRFLGSFINRYQEIEVDASILRLGG